jgi:serine protease Do
MGKPLPMAFIDTVKKSVNRLLTRTAQKCACVSAATYRAATVRERCRTKFLLSAFVTFAVGCAFGQLPELMPLQVRPSGSYLGVSLADIDANRAKSLKLTEVMGVEILAVEEGEAADQAGIRAGDVILSYNGEKILGAQQFIRLVSETPPGRRVRFVCSRAGEQKEIWITTGTPHALDFESLDTLSRGRITDVPSPMMLWRNLVLGIESESLNEQLAQSYGVKQGILIWAVSLGSPAQRAGLRAGDVVTGFCGRLIQSPRELGTTLQQLQVGQKPISINLVRDHKPVSVAISLDGGH